LPVDILLPAARSVVLHTWLVIREGAVVSAPAQLKALASKKVSRTSLHCK
jgi:hypothetical protein